MTTQDFIISLFSQVDDMTDVPLINQFVDRMIVLTDTVLLIPLGGRAKERNRKIWLKTQGYLAISPIARLGDPSMVSNGVDVSERPFKWAARVDTTRSRDVANMIYSLSRTLHQMHRGKHELAFLLLG